MTTLQLYDQIIDRVKVQKAAHRHVIQDHSCIIYHADLQKQAEAIWHSYYKLQYELEKLRKLEDPNE